MDKVRSTAEIPRDTLVFIDANVLYLFLRGPNTIRKACSSLLEQVESGKVRGFTSSLVLDELAYKLLLRKIEEDLGKNPLIAIRERPALISEASHYVDEGLSIVLGIENLIVESVGKQHVEELTMFMERYSLLPRDSLHISVMLTTGCKDIASTDQDFDKVAGITRWSPSTSGEGLK